jgi:hypothetical protein
VGVGEQRGRAGAGEPGRPPPDPAVLDAGYSRPAASNTTSSGLAPPGTSHHSTWSSTWLGASTPGRGCTVPELAPVGVHRDEGVLDHILRRLPVAHQRRRLPHQRPVIRGVKRYRRRGIPVSCRRTRGWGSALGEAAAPLPGTGTGRLAPSPGTAAAMTRSASPDSGTFSCSNDRIVPPDNAGPMAATDPINHTRLPAAQPSPGPWGQPGQPQQPPPTRTDCRKARPLSIPSAAKA